MYQTILRNTFGLFKYYCGAVETLPAIAVVVGEMVHEIQYRFIILWASNIICHEQSYISLCYRIFGSHAGERLIAYKIIILLKNIFIPMHIKTDSEVAIKQIRCLIIYAKSAAAVLQLRFRIQLFEQPVMCFCLA